ncbi:MFS transporter [Brevibacillus centrosporus]|uniref:MFS transporter n=1 Tax=Brevibacillus centrosporus TaxID=54910 RepID=UPI002E221B16|nr:MFS transporter [Brevibacillus centrosporus]
MKRSILYVLTLGIFLTATSELIVGGILPIMAEDLHISVALAGQLITAFSLAYAIGTPIAVALTSHLERKKVLLGALLVFILGCLLALWSPSFLILLGSRVVVGTSAGLFLVVSFGAVSRLVSPDKIGSSISTLILGFSAALVLGTPIGIAISNSMGWRVIFLFLAILGAVLLLVLIRLLPTMEGSPPVPFRSQLQLLLHPVLLLTFSFTLFRESGISMMNTYVSPYLVQVLHYSISETGLLMLVLGLIGVLGARLGGHAADKWGTRRIILFSIVVLAASFALLPLMVTSPIMGAALLGVAFGTLFFVSPSIQTYLIQLSPASADLLLSVHSSFIQLGLASGAAIGGLLIHTTATVAYNPWGAGLFLMIGLGFILVAFSKQKQAHIVSG